ncbi:hypothetical protein [Peptostreptococcus equinus]|uniref:Uncharacterized protein n=1 Tax=Peptostreptococcus equinus TaxID=3003601 RepID=A0ABY7JN37_9FIRM|nr:hypothetical protein [Peptostreptococcus sp. CBA3647]WAW14757.1 hypothetical protein O0R46_09250 [Peptostreptococcus sp. CBA3647]
MRHKIIIELKEIDLTGDYNCPENIVNVYVDGQRINDVLGVEVNPRFPEKIKIILEASGFEIRTVGEGESSED